MCCHSRTQHITIRDKSIRFFSGVSPRASKDLCRNIRAICVSGHWQTALFSSPRLNTRWDTLFNVGIWFYCEIIPVRDKSVTWDSACVFVYTCEESENKLGKDFPSLAQFFFRDGFATFSRSFKVANLIPIYFYDIDVLTLQIFFHKKIRLSDVSYRKLIQLT